MVEGATSYTERNYILVLINGDGESVLGDWDR